MPDEATDPVAPEFALHLRRIALPMAMGAAAAILCWWAAGVTLGLFIGVLFMIALLTPSFAAGARVESTSANEAANMIATPPLLTRLIAGGAVVDGSALVLLATVAVGVIGFMQWLQVYVVLLSFAAALVGIVHLLSRLRAPATLAAAVAVIAAVAWLTWPVWLSAALSDSLVGMLTPCHPLFAINGVVQHLGLWTEQAGVVYHHTPLNQDFAYALPASIWPAVVLHVMVFVAGALPRLWHDGTAG